MLKKAIATSLLALTMFTLYGCLETDSTLTGASQTSTVLFTDNPGGDAPYETLFDNTVYKKFVISFTEESFLKLIDDMENYHDMYGSYRDNTIQEVDLHYEDGDGNSFTAYEVGFRTKGNVFSRRLPVIKDDQGDIIGYQQVSFQLEFNDTFSYPAGSTSYQDLKSRELFGLEQLNFKYVKEDDYGAVTELAAYDFYRQSGIISSNASLAIVYFRIGTNTIPYGLYLLQEPIDDEFVKRYFGANGDGSIGDLYKCLWQGTPATLNHGSYYGNIGLSDYEAGYRLSYALKTNKEGADVSSLVEFIDALNIEATEEYFQSLPDIVDMDPLLRAYAIGFLIGSPDDYRSDANNYYLYINAGKAYYIPYDMDQSMGYGWNPYGDYGIDLDVLFYPPAQSMIYSYTNLKLAYPLLTYPEYQTTYLDYLLEFTDPDTGIFSLATYTELFVLARGLYEAEIQSEGHMGLNLFSMDDRYMKVSDYFSQKIQFVRTQSLEYLNPSE